MECGSGASVPSGAKALSIRGTHRRGSAAQELKIPVDGTKSVGASAKLVQLSAGSTAAINSIFDPTRVMPVESTVKGVGKEFTRTLPGYSIEVLEIAAQ
jgi:alpha-N-arabinofuranosidase